MVLDQGPEGLFGADVTDDPARRDTQPDSSCRHGSYAPVRPAQMKCPCLQSDFPLLHIDITPLSG